MRKKLTLPLLFAFILAGCASGPDKRPEYTTSPPLENGWGRIYVRGGTMHHNFNFKIWTENMNGPVYINSQRVWMTGKNEHIAIDVLPGVYEAQWLSNESTVFYPLGAIGPAVPSVIKISAGESQYFTSDIFREAGVLTWRVTQRPSLDGDSKLVSYLKFNQQPTSNRPVQQTSSEVDRLRAEAAAARQRQFEEKPNQSRLPSVAPAQVVTPLYTDRLSLDASKKKCADLGFKPATEGFGKCVLQLSK